MFQYLHLHISIPGTTHYTIICGNSATRIDERAKGKQQQQKEKRNNRKQIYMNLCVPSRVEHVEQCFKYIFYVESIIYSLSPSVCVCSEPKTQWVCVCVWAINKKEGKFTLSENLSTTFSFGSYSVSPFSFSISVSPPPIQFFNLVPPLRFLSALLLG